MSVSTEVVIRPDFYVAATASADELDALMNQLLGALQLG